METVLRASEVKQQANKLDKIWKEMLTKYYREDGSLNEDACVSVDCPACAHKGKAKSFKVNDFSHVTCTSCETVYVTPRLKDEYIQELYDAEFYSAQYVESMIPIFDKRKKLIGQRKFKQIEEFAPEKGRVLDIGGGIGEVSSVFIDQGWDTHIIEMNPTAVNWLQDKGYSSVFHGSFDNYTSQDKFDVIMAWGVLEHVVNPAEFLSKVRSLLKPGGLFVNEVPHGNSLLVDYTRNNGIDPKRIILGEQHLVLYSIKAYNKLHETQGFQKIRIQTNGLDLATILRNKNCDLPNDVLQSLQQCIDEANFGDLLRGFWTIPDHATLN